MSSTDRFGIADYNPENPWKVVTHFRPDTDAWVCLWLAHRFVIGRILGRETTDIEPVFVRAGERLSAEDSAGYNVLYMDTGLGLFDQHALKEHERTSSAQMLAEHFGVDQEPGARLIIDLTVRTDNVETDTVPPDSIHHVIKGLPYRFRNVSNEAEKWSVIWDHVFVMLDCIYEHEKMKAQSVEVLKKVGRKFNLRNGLVVTTLWGNPGPREAAFDAGTDAAVWTVEKRRGDWFGIQLNNDRMLDLTPVFVAIRKAEAAKRGVELTDEELNNPRPVEKVGAWFLHGSKKLIGCGTRSHPLEIPEEFSKLDKSEIRKIVCAELAKMELAGTLTVKKS